MPNFSSHYPILSQQSLLNIIDKTKKGWEKNLTWISCHCINTLIPKQMWLLLGVSGEGNGTPLQYSCLENPMDGGAWWAAAHGVAKSRTRLSDFTFTFHFPALEKEMATHSSVLVWRISGTGEPGGLPSMGLHRVGHNWRDLAAAAEAVQDNRDRTLSLNNLQVGEVYIDIHTNVTTLG